ncbi:MAG: hypothetical protein J0M19_13340 [Sphingomonadales bacterium]|nr:hypothetical protein [Sphingomonadales bacterium]
MGWQFRRNVLTVVTVATLGVLSACGPKSTPPPPPPPPPAPPPVVYIPPRPLPPLGAAASLVVPPVGVDGTRRTVNTGITPAQTLWNFRSAYNVAALNCMKPEHADILVGYKKFLVTHKKALTTANKTVDSEFRKRHGTAFVRPREAYMTQVYNFYAFPPTVARFCDAALIMARESMTVKPADLQPFSVRSLAMLDGVFETFYKSYDQYRADAAAWDAKYAPAATAPVAPVSGPTPTPGT